MKYNVVPSARARIMRQTREAMCVVAFECVNQNCGSGNPLISVFVFFLIIWLHFQNDSKTFIAHFNVRNIVVLQCDKRALIIERIAIISLS